jgi:hypothetical protein
MNHVFESYEEFVTALDDIVLCDDCVRIGREMEAKEANRAR